MIDEEFSFLNDLLQSTGPSGAESEAQERWRSEVATAADWIDEDSYGNLTAVIEGDGPTIGFAAHGDIVGMRVREIDENGFIRPEPVGYPDESTSRGQYVTVHTNSGKVRGVVGAVPYHLQEEEQKEETMESQFIDIGVEGKEQAEKTVEIGDPISYTTPIQRLSGSRVAAHGMDNRTGQFAVARAFCETATANPDISVCAVSTVHEELGYKGAEMLSLSQTVDALIVVDVTHALDYPDPPSNKRTRIELGAGPVLTRGGGNHPELVRSMLEFCREKDLRFQIQSRGRRTATDLDAFYLTDGGIPTTLVSIPNRYMHTPVELVDLNDVRDLVNLLTSFTKHGVLPESIRF